MSDEILDPDAPSEADWLPVRAELRDVAVPAEAREAAIAAALGAFDELHTELVGVAAAAAAPTAADRPADVVSLQTRMGSRWSLWVGAAAAAVAVLAVGGVLINGRGGSSDDQVSIETASAVESAFSTDVAGLAEPVPAGGTDGQPEADNLDATKVEASTAQVAPTIGSIGAGAVAETAAPAVTSELMPTEVVADTAGLTDYVVRTSAAPPMIGLPDSPCRPDGSELIGVVTFQGVTAIVVRNADSSFSAIDIDGCAVLATVTP